MEIIHAKANAKNNGTFTTDDSLWWQAMVIIFFMATEDNDDTSLCIQISLCHTIFPALNPTCADASGLVIYSKTLHTSCRWMAANPRSRSSPSVPWNALRKQQLHLTINKWTKPALYTIITPWSGQALDSTLNQRSKTTFTL